MAAAVQNKAMKLRTVELMMVVVGVSVNSGFEDALLSVVGGVWWAVNVIVNNRVMMLCLDGRGRK
jgi:hypothetical protein